MQMRVLQAIAKTQGLGAVQSEVAKECGIQAKNFFLLYKVSHHWECLCSVTVNMEWLRRYFAEV